MSAAGKGLYLSLLLRPEWPASKSGRLSAVAAVSTVRMLEMLGVKDVRIKYPNDIVTAGRKMGGLLIEPRIGNGRIVFAVLGIGVNLYHDLHDLQQTGLAHIATSCRLQGCEPILTEAAVTLIQTIAMNYQKAAGPAWNSLLQQWINYGGTPELPG
jgi:BirA family biotin operon repressor/biotin-[acetyl-CoA-carboxylase] ligase